MHSGSDIGSVFGTGSKIKNVIEKSNIIGKLSGDNAVSNIEKARF
jgi:hypothetical protein